MTLRIDYDYEFDRAGREDRTGVQRALLVIARSLEAIAAAQSSIAADLHTLVRSAPHLTRLELSLMPKTITVGQTATAHITGTGSDGQPFKFTSADSVALAASVPGDVSFGAPTFNADGSVDIVVTGVAADAGDVLTATVDGVVSNNDTLTITAPAPTLASVTLALQ